jgi:hypothetical protein
VIADVEADVTAESAWFVEELLEDGLAYAVVRRRDPGFWHLLGLP